MQHGVIRSYNFGLKDFYSVCRRHLGQLAEQDAAETTSLKIVCDRKGDFGALISVTGVECVTNDALFVTTTSDEFKGLVQVRFTMSFGSDAGAILKTVKSQPARLFRKRSEQRAKTRLIRRTHHANTHGGTIAQYDVAVTMRCK